MDKSKIDLRLGDSDKHRSTSNIVKLNQSVLHVEI